MPDREDVLVALGEKLAELEKIAAVGLERVARQPTLEFEVREEVDDQLVELRDGNGHADTEFAAPAPRPSSRKRGCAPREQAAAAQRRREERALLSQVGAHQLGWQAAARVAVEVDRVILRRQRDRRQQ